MVCFVTLGEHDALKSDQQNAGKVVPLSSGMPTYAANRTDVVKSPLPALPYGEEVACFTTLGEHEYLAY